MSMLLKNRMNNTIKTTLNDNGLKMAAHIFSL